MRLFLVVEYDRHYLVHISLPLSLSYRPCSVASTFARCSRSTSCAAPVPP
ncbi:MAG: hypothetical protein MZV70_07770 [Desulfobacterales bacterium]|nr:hypothetical protein [Desulfobacterales bacterium]